MGKFRDHKIHTKDGFAKVKRRHNDFEKRFDEVENRVKEVEYVLAQLNDLPPININRTKKRR